ncbi:hypothetical protein [Moraxella sp. ZY200743]|uniref:hypothetical protein n=1 Tax=Moraxella sp. ZY200743 TaxID=2911970 RepID=UPI003D7D2F17
MNVFLVWLIYNDLSGLFDLPKVSYPLAVMLYMTIFAFTVLFLLSTTTRKKISELSDEELNLTALVRVTLLIFCVVVYFIARAFV